MNFIKLWVDNARFRSLPQSFFPAIVAICFSAKSKEFSVCIGLLAVFGVVVAHLGINLLDDYFDYIMRGSEFRNIMKKNGFHARTKCCYIISGQITLKQLLVVSIFLCSVALTVGVIIWIFRGSIIFYLMLIAAGLGIFYSAPPLRLSYHALGEVTIGLMFGPLLMGGICYASCGKIDFSLIFISIPIGLLVMTIGYVHSIMDHDPDKEIGKLTLISFCRNKKLILFFLFCLLIIPFCFIIVGVTKCYLSIYYLFVLLVLPMSIMLFYLILQYIYYPDKKISHYFWIGQICKWRRIQNMNNNWFMIRWILSRDILSFFCFITIIVCIFS